MAGASLVAQMVKNVPAMQGLRFDSWVRKIPGKGNGYPLPPTPLFLPGEFHGQRSLAGYSP